MFLIAIQEYFILILCRGAITNFPSWKTQKNSTTPPTATPTKPCTEPHPLTLGQQLLARIIMRRACEDSPVAVGAC